MKRIACIGECMVELSERPDGTLTHSFGGDALNTALYLARLGVAVDSVTALGADPFSDEMIQAWKAEGIGTELVLRVPDRLPGLYLIQTNAAGERRFFYWRASAPVRQLFRLPGTTVTEAALYEAEQIYLSGITLSLLRPPASIACSPYWQQRVARALASHSTRTFAPAAGQTWSPHGRSTSARSAPATWCWQVRKITACCTVPPPRMR